MAAATFTPTEEVQLFCRFCKKVMPAQLERSIAGSGRTVDKESTFEYYCTKCHHTTCMSGTDLLAADVEESDPREYTANEMFVVGEVIRHAKFEDTGVVVGKDLGTPSRILVQFENVGLKKLVEGI